MTDWPLLSATIFLPLGGALFLLLIRDDEPGAGGRALRTGLALSLGTLTLASGILIGFDPAQGFQWQESMPWLPDLGIHYHVGVDGISVWLVFLTALVTPLALIASWRAVDRRMRDFVASLLLLEAAAIGTFSALDFVLFFLFYEASLIPLFMLVGIWGGQRRAAAAYKVFLYTMAGSVFLLLAILTLYTWTGTFDIPTLMQAELPAGLQTWLWFAMFASFAIKMPLWPVHTWLPDVHVQAPTAGSMMLAGVLMKFGAYGFLRFLLPITPDASEALAPLVFAMGVVTLVYNSVVALAQTDVKRLLAYMTVAHMGVTAIGVFARTTESIEGVIVLMVAQGLAAAGLFMAAGMIHERTGTYDLNRLSGVAARMPALAAVMMVLVLAAVALPGTGPFVGEILVLIGAMQVNVWVAVMLATVIILAPVYMFRLYHGCMFGPKPIGTTRADLTLREMVAFAPVLAVVFWLGLHPPTMLNTAATAVAALVDSPSMLAEATAPLELPVQVSAASGALTDR